MCRLCGSCLAIVKRSPGRMARTKGPSISVRLQSHLFACPLTSCIKLSHAATPQAHAIKFGLNYCKHSEFLALDSVKEPKLPHVFHVAWAVQPQDKVSTERA